MVRHGAHFLQWTLSSQWDDLHLHVILINSVVKYNTQPAALYLGYSDVPFPLFFPTRMNVQNEILLIPDIAWNASKFGWNFQNYCEVFLYLTSSCMTLMTLWWVELHYENYFNGKLELKEYNCRLWWEILDLLHWSCLFEPKGSTDNVTPFIHLCDN